VARILEKHADRGVTLAALVSCDPKFLSSVQKTGMGQGQGVAWLTDPSRAVHRALGLGRTSWASFFRPKVLARYFWSLLHGFLPRAAAPGEDLLQLGGDFLWNREGKLVWAHRSDDAGDRPNEKTIVGILENENLWTPLSPRHQ